MRLFLVYLLLSIFYLNRVTGGIEIIEVRGISLWNLVIYLLVIYWVLWGALKRRFFENETLYIYILLFVSTVILSIPVKMILTDIPRSTVIRDIITVKNWIIPFILFVVLLTLVDNRKMCDRILGGLVVLLFAFLLTQLLATFGVTSYRAGTLFRVGRMGGFGNAGEYSLYVILFLPLVISGALFSKNMFLRGFYAVVSFMGFLGLANAGSRNGAVSTAFTLVLYLVLLKREKIISKMAVISMVSILMVSAVTAWIAMPSFVREAVAEKFIADESEDLNAYTSGRFGVLLNGLSLFMERPFIGHGLGSFLELNKKRFRHSGNTHNDYLLYLVEYGLTGFCFFILLHAMIFRHIWPLARGSGSRRAKVLFISFIAGFSGHMLGMFAVNMITTRILLWIFIAVIIKYALLLKQEMAEASHAV